MRAIDLLFELQENGDLPWSLEQKPPKGAVPSRSECRRWLEKRSVLINGRRPLPYETIEGPIKELVFFPKSKSINTFLSDVSLSPLAIRKMDR